MKKVIQYPGVGPVEISARHGVKNTSYRVSVKGVSIVTSPAMFPHVLPLTAERVQWIQEAQAHVASRVPELMIVPDGNFRTLSFKVTFEVMKMKRPALKSKYEDGLLTIVYDETMDMRASDTQLVIQRMVKFYMKRSAEEYLPERLEKLALEYGFTYQQVRINSARGRWGSCSATGNINLSCYLMMLPAYLIDYVLLHELCHTKEMNHGVHFKALMQQLFPNMRQLDLELKQIGKQIAAFKA